MKIKNQSRKIISIRGEALLPEEEIELLKGEEAHPIIQMYIKNGVIADANTVMAPLHSISMNEEEKARISEEAIAKYKAEQEKIAMEKEAEIKAISTMKKQELITKAMGMGIETNDSDTAEILKEKIIVALNE